MTPTTTRTRRMFGTVQCTGGEVVSVAVSRRASDCTAVQVMAGKSDEPSGALHGFLAPAVARKLAEALLQAADATEAGATNTSTPFGTSLVVDRHDEAGQFVRRDWFALPHEAYFEGFVTGVHALEDVLQRSRAKHLGFGGPTGSSVLFDILRAAAIAANTPASQVRGTRGAGAGFLRGAELVLTLAATDPHIHAALQAWRQQCERDLPSAEASRQRSEAA